MSAHPSPISLCRVLRDALRRVLCSAQFYSLVCALLASACASAPLKPGPATQPKPIPAPRSLEVACGGIVSSADGFVVLTGDSNLALITANSAQHFAANLAVLYRAQASEGGFIVQGFGSEEAQGVEHFASLDLHGVEQCSEDTPKMLGCAQPSLLGKVDFVGLFGGKAVFVRREPVERQSAYGITPCGAATLLGTCGTDEWFVWSDGPVCQDARRFHVLGGVAAGRLSPDDKAYSATGQGVLRVQRDSAETLKLRWFDRDPAASWEHRIALPEPLEDVQSAAGNREGAVLWLRAETSQPAALVVVTRRGPQLRQQYGAWTAFRGRVAVSDHGWAALVPRAQLPTPEVRCDLVHGTFEE